MVLTRPPGTAATARRTAAKSRPAMARISPHVRRISRGRQIHVKTSGVTFDRNTGVVTTEQRGEFRMTQGSGSAMGATYDSQSGHLTLDASGGTDDARGGDAVQIHAQHAEFDRGAQLLLAARGDGGLSRRAGDAAQATILFRDGWLCCNSWMRRAGLC